LGFVVPGAPRFFYSYGYVWMTSVFAGARFAAFASSAWPWGGGPCLRCRWSTLRLHRPVLRFRCLAVDTNHADLLSPSLLGGGTKHVDYCFDKVLTIRVRSGTRNPGELLARGYASQTNNLAHRGPARTELRATAAVRSTSVTPTEVEPLPLVFNAGEHVTFSYVRVGPCSRTVCRRPSSDRTSPFRCAYGVDHAFGTAGTYRTVPRDRAPSPS